MWSMNEPTTTTGRRELRVRSARPAAMRVLIHTILLIGLTYLLGQGVYLLYAERRHGTAPLLSLGFALGLLLMAWKNAVAEWLRSGTAGSDTPLNDSVPYRQTRLLVFHIQSGAGPLILASARRSECYAEQSQGVYLAVTSVDHAKRAVAKAIQLSQRLNYPLTVVVGGPLGPGRFFLRMRIHRVAKLFADISVQLAATSIPYYRAHCLPRGATLADHLTALSATSVIVLPACRWTARTRRQQLADRLRRNGLVVCDGL